MNLALVMAGFLAIPPGRAPDGADQQDRAALDKMVEQDTAAAAKAPNDPEAQYRLALAASYSAEVALEQHDRKAARAVAERGIKAAEKAVALKPDRAEYYRVLATLYGQAITDVMSGLSYGPRSKDAINKALERAPNSSDVYVARGVGQLLSAAAAGRRQPGGPGRFPQGHRTRSQERRGLSLAGVVPAQG